MFNSTLITLENSLLNPHIGGLPVRQEKRKKINNKIYFLCTSGSMAVGLLRKPTCKVVGSVVGAWELMVFPSLATAMEDIMAI